ncbi:MAG: hypothetical protein DHS80DRAFT_29577 [Piptocephalis tieghemiana]|nr:MAG: hypothetical protein DHS80DRAFT_29577 [Piptocephalis tieghemiana]
MNAAPILGNLDTKVEAKPSESKVRASQRLAVQALSAEDRARAQQRQLQALERDNYSMGSAQAVPLTKDTRGRSKSRYRSVGESSSRKGNELTLTRGRHTLEQLVQEAHLERVAILGEPTYLSIVVPPSTYPARRLCTVCGYEGAYHCLFPPLIEITILAI